MALKVTTPGANTGFDPVGADDYRAGMVAARDASGNIVVCGSANDPDSGSKPIGILGEDRLTQSLQETTQVNEQVTITTAVAIALAHDDHVGGTSSTSPSLRAVVLANSGGGTNAPGHVLVAGTDFTINGVTGVITPLANGGANATGDVWDVTYAFLLNDDFEKNFRGVNFKGATDDTEGSKKATVWKGSGEYETDQFDTAVAYSIGTLLFVSKANHPMGPGLFTVTSGGSVDGGTATARVIKVPTASDPFLGLEFVPVLA